jgi:hypothetical protein
LVPVAVAGEAAEAAQRAATTGVSETADMITTVTTTAAGSTAEEETAVGEAVTVEEEAISRWSENLYTLSPSPY